MIHFLRGNDNAACMTVPRTGHTEMRLHLHFISSPSMFLVVCQRLVLWINDEHIRAIICWADNEMHAKSIIRYWHGQIYSLTVKNLLFPYLTCYSIHYIRFTDWIVKKWYTKYLNSFVCFPRNCLRISTYCIASKPRKPLKYLIMQRPLRTTCNMNIVQNGNYLKNQPLFQFLKNNHRTLDY